jgi:flagellar basal-body rod protein FlgG
MGREIYPAMSGGTRALKMLDVLSNNLANVNTTGFKADRATFTLHSPTQAANLDPDSAEARLAAAWTTLDGEATDFSQGSLQPSGSATHFALIGDGFFQLEGGDGVIRLTRDGSFVADPEGLLAGRSGDRVLDDKGSTIKVGGGQLVVDEGGEVKVGGKVVGRIGFVDVADRDALSKVAGNRFETGAGQALVQAAPQVRQFHLEGSNVQAVRAMTELVAISRYYEAFSKSLESSSEMDQQLNNTVGRIDR